jgi:large subunit ribosomal protein L32
MPNPKRRHSKSRTSKRRAHDHLQTPDTSICPNCGAKQLPHRVCLECGHYRGRQIIEVETE